MPRSSPPITQLPSGRYQVRFRDRDGRQRAESFERKRDALSFLDSTRVAVREGSWVDPSAGRERFTAFATRWAASQDWAERSVESFGPTLRRITAVLGDPRLSEVDKLDLERLRQGLVEHPYAHATVSLTLGYAKTIMRAAHEAGLIARDPTVGVRNPRRRDGATRGRVGPDQVPTRAEVLAILDAAPERYRAAIALGAAGLRVGEVLGVQADRIDFGRGELLVDQQLQYVHSRISLKTPKRDKVRTVRLPSVTLLELRRHVRDHQGAGLLFRSLRGGPNMRADQFYASAWWPALVGAGLGKHRFVFHSLRHFCASSMLAEGVPVPAVAGYIGDTPGTLMNVYAHWLRDDGDVPALVLDRILGPEPAAAEVVTR